MLLKSVAKILLPSTPKKKKLLQLRTSNEDETSRHFSFKVQKWKSKGAITWGLGSGNIIMWRKKPLKATMGFSETRACLSITLEKQESNYFRDVHWRGSLIPFTIQHIEQETPLELHTSVNASFPAYKCTNSTDYQSMVCLASMNPEPINDISYFSFSIKHFRAAQFPMEI